MPEYRRFIAYFYEYIDGKKQRNTGFAKVELRNGMWRILFRLNVGSVPEPPIQVYGFVREGGYLLGMPMGVMRPGREISEEWAYRAEMPVGKETYRLEDLSGIRIQSGDSRCFMTVWDDEEINPDKFVLKLPEEKARMETDDAVKASAAEAESETSARPDEVPEQSSVGAMAESEIFGRLDERSEQPAVGNMAESEPSAKLNEALGMPATEPVNESGEIVEAKAALKQADMKAVAESETFAGSNKVPEMYTVDSVKGSGEILKAKDTLKRTDMEAAAELEMSAGRNEVFGLSATDVLNESGGSAKAKDIQVQSDIEAVSEPETSARSNEVMERSAAESEISAKPDNALGMPTAAAAVKSETFVKASEVPKLSGVGSMAESKAVMTPENVSGASAPRAADGLWQGAKKEGQTSKSVTAGSENDLPPSPRGPVIIHAQSANQKTAGKDHRNARANCMRDLLQRRERFEPFQDDEIVNCVQIMPCDIVKLQQEQWQVGRSSFLQHGYYQYRHLLLGTMRDGRYILGVPGMRNPQEKYMAEMFGFPHFKTSKICSCGRAFGYWYKELQE